MSPDTQDEYEEVLDQFDRWTIANKEAIQEQEVIREKLDICDRMIYTLTDKKNRMKVESHVI